MDQHSLNKQRGLKPDNIAEMQNTFHRVILLLPTIHTVISIKIIANKSLLTKVVIFLIFELYTHSNIISSP